jgi:hypothetical protein
MLKLPEGTIWFRIAKINLTSMRTNSKVSTVIPFSKSVDRNSGDYIAIPKSNYDMKIIVVYCSQSLHPILSSEIISHVFYPTRSILLTMFHSIHIRSYDISSVVQLISPLLPGWMIIPENVHNPILHLLTVIMFLSSYYGDIMFVVVVVLWQLLLLLSLLFFFCCHNYDVIAQFNSWLWKPWPICCSMMYRLKKWCFSTAIYPLVN